MEVTDEQAVELIHILFQIMRTMIDINFGLNSVQFTVFPSETKTTSVGDNELNLSPSQKNIEFNGVAEGVSVKAQLPERNPS